LWWILTLIKFDQLINKEENMKKAFVEVKYSSNSASMAGASCGILQRAEVIEVEADDIGEATKKAVDKFKDHLFTTVRSVNFLRWA
jgi:hypothetical protein